MDDWPVLVAVGFLGGRIYGIRGTQKGCPRQLDVLRCETVISGIFTRLSVEPRAVPELVQTDYVPTVRTEHSKHFFSRNCLS